MFRLFRSVDLFGKSVVLNFNGKKKSRTLVGAWLSFLFFGFAIWAIYQLGKDIYFRKDPKAIMSESFSEDPAPMVISPETFNFAFGVQHPTTKAHYIDESVYTVEASIIQTKRDVNQNGGVEIATSSIPLVIEVCTKEHFGSLASSFQTIELNQLYCLKKEQPSLDHVQIQGVFESPTFEYISISIKQCDPQISRVSCAQKETLDEMLGGAWLATYFTNFAIEPKNYTNPKVGYRDSYHTSISNTFFKELTLWLGHVELDSDPGWIVREVNIENFIKLDHTTELMNLKTTSAAMMNMIVRVEKIITNYQRSYVKVQDVLAKANGIISAIIIVGIIFLGPYSRMKFYERLINELFEVRTFQPANMSKKRRSTLKQSCAQTTTDGDDPCKPPKTGFLNLNFFSKGNRKVSVISHPETVATDKDGNNVNNDLEQPTPRNSYQPRGQSNTFKKDSIESNELKVVEEDAQTKDSNDGTRQSQRLSYQEIWNRNIERISRFDNKNPAVKIPSFIEQPRQPNLRRRGSKKLTQKLIYDSYEAGKDSDGLSALENLIFNKKKQNIECCKEGVSSHDKEKRGTVRNKWDKIQEKEEAMYPKIIEEDKEEKSSDDDDDNDEEIFMKKADKLPTHLIKDSDKINITFWEYLSGFFWKSKPLKEKLGLLKEGIRRIDERLDLFNVLKKFREFDKLKVLLLENEQLILFDTLPKPELCLTHKEASKNQDKKSFSHQQLKEINFIAEKRKNDLIIFSYKDLKKKPSKTMIDKKIIEIYDDILEN